ncbi:hypothetical protein PAXRUDRAFT_144278, partial [Paxillus rubicundulus Ve08.2h10]
PTCLTLVSPSNFQIWKLQITVKPCQEKILGVALGANTLPQIPPPPYITLTISGTATGEEVWKWMEQNEKAHRIVQDSISDALLLKNVELCHLSYLSAPMKPMLTNADFGLISHRLLNGFV